MADTNRHDNKTDHNNTNVKHQQPSWLETDLTTVPKHVAKRKSLCKDPPSCGVSDVSFLFLFLPFQSSRRCSPDDGRWAALNWSAASPAAPVNWLPLQSPTMTPHCLLHYPHRAVLTQLACSLSVPFNSLKDAWKSLLQRGRWTPDCSKMPVHFSHSSSGFPPV